MQAFEKELRKIGFSDKEAKVYLASLSVGPAPVQEISKKANVNRATTYVMIESLTERGLMSSLQKGKKRLFVAESPENIVAILKTQREELEENLRPSFVPHYLWAMACSAIGPFIFVK